MNFKGGVISEEIDKFIINLDVDNVVISDYAGRVYVDLLLLLAREVVSAPKHKQVKNTNQIITFHQHTHHLMNLSNNDHIKSSHNQIRQNQHLCKSSIYLLTS